jgi:hypothetical protein
MRRTRFTLAAAALLVACPSFIRAQATSPSSPAAAAAPAHEATPAARKAAEELLRLMNVEQVIRSGTESAFDAQLKANPLMAPFRATMQTWVDKYLTWQEFGPKLTQVYAEEFTEPELRELIAFYKTPIGRKTAQLTPLLGKRGAQVGAEVAEAHLPELQQMIQARVAELQKEGASPSAKPPQQDSQPPASPAPKKP